MALVVWGRNLVVLFGFTLGLIIGMVVTLLALPYYVAALEYVAALVRPEYAIDAVLLALAIVIGATPIGFGTTSLIMICAFIYRWWAFPIIYVCYIVSGSITFATTRLLVKNEWISIQQIEGWFPRYSRHIDAVKDEVAVRGILSTFLLQMSTCPFGISCAALALTPIKKSEFIIGLFCSRIKMILYVYIGISARNLSDLTKKITSGSNFDAMDTQAILSIVSFIATVLTLVVFGLLCQRRLNARTATHAPPPAHIPVLYVMSPALTAQPNPDAT